MIPDNFDFMLFFDIIHSINEFFYFLLICLIKFIALILPILIAVAYLTLVERKIIAAMQGRLGPDSVGYCGILQPLADGLKLLLKETIIPSQANRVIFLIAPIITLFLSFLGWLIIPFTLTNVFLDLNIGVLYIFAISSLGVYGIISSGWSSNSRYAFLGALRAAAQMISYEISIGLILISVLLFVGSFNLSEIVFAQKQIWFVIPFFPCFLMFFISALAETNRPPFDLPEAEAELVSGYNVEYSAMGFALFFLGEYSNIILMSSFCVILFFGGWLPPFNFFLFCLIPNIFWFIFKILFFLFLFIWVRVSFPRYRYDQLMRLGWKVFLPISLAFVLFFSSIFFFFN